MVTRTVGMDTFHFGAGSGDRGGGINEITSNISIFLRVNISRRS